MDREVVLRPACEQRKKPRQMREVAGDQDVARLTDQLIAHPFGRVVRLQMPCGGEFRQRVARAPERFRRLFRAQFAAVPDGGGPDTALRREVREPIDARPANGRERPARIDVRTYRIAVMNEKKLQT